jgi:anti-sigma B factor antagonist
VLTFEIVGEFDLTMVPVVRERLLNFVANSGEDISVDLSQVSFMDSSALGVLVAARRRARRTGIDLVLHAPRPNVWRVLTVTGMDKVFDCTGSPAEA